MASLLGGAYTDSESSEEEGNKGAEQGKPESELDAEPEPKRPRKHEPEPTPGDFIDPSFDDLLPPVTNASPNPEVQERIANFIAKSEQQQRDFTQSIKNMKEYGNPAMLSKVCEYFEVNEKGSNYPKNLFDPQSYEACDFYDAISADSRKQQASSNIGDLAAAAAREAAERIAARLSGK